MIKLSDPSTAKSDSEQVYLYYKRQIELNEKWMFEILEDIANSTKPIEQARQELKVHLVNLKNLYPVIVKYEQG